jgi:internalin A
MLMTKDELMGLLERVAREGRTTLDLSNQGLDRLPPEIGQLTQLQSLHLGQNRLSGLPPEITRLTQLQSLDLSLNRLSGLPPEITRLTQLQSLYLGGNRLSGLPPEITRLTQLQSLDLSLNRLSGLPPEITRLTQLQSLYLGGNRLSGLPPEIGRLIQLQTLYLHGNQLSALPQSLLQLPNLIELYLHNNPQLDLPAEILGPSIEVVRIEGRQPARPSDILTYYFENQRAARPLNEVKLLLVGRGESGKSSIRDRLVFNTFDPHKQETPGIQIDPWSLTCGRQTVLVRVWDFAGQEITHATHQFFLTERSVYLLVLDARAGTQNWDAEYWLRLISAFGKDSPVLVALNKSVKKAFDVDRFALREKYPSLRAFVVTDCAEPPVGIEGLRKEIAEAIESLDAVRQPFPTVWARLKDKFSKMKDNYLHFDAFRKRCAEEGESDPVRQEQLARILHALGIILYYGDDPRLRDTTVLNPRWVTESIYTLLRLKAHPQTDGTLTFKEARAALPDEKPKMVTYLIELMRRFELCFPVGEEDEDEKRWLVPELLSRFQPPLGQEWLDSQAVRLRYEYKALPEGLIPRFITRTYPLSADQARWHGGVVLSLEGARALVRANATENQIEVTVIGAEGGRNRLVKLIRNHFQYIHRDVQGLDPKELVEVEGRRGVYKSVQVLEVDERESKVTTVESDRGSVTIDQTRELNRISDPAARNPLQPRLKLFLSYSHKDARLRDVFRENLALLEADGLITSWFDGQILPSAEWDKEIRRELQEADLVVFLVSVPFLSSKYIRGVEMRCALERRLAGKAELVAVILDAQCDWKSRDFARYQVLPREVNVKAVRSWRRHADAFTHVEQALRQLIQEMLAKRGGDTAVGTTLPSWKLAL